MNHMKKESKVAMTIKLAIILVVARKDLSFGEKIWSPILLA